MTRGKVTALAILSCLSACSGGKGTAELQPGISAPVAPKPNIAVMKPAAPGGPTPYYVEFRARLSTEDVPGHTYLVYGPQDSSGRPLEEHVAGFYPLVGPLGILVGTVAFPGEVGDGFVQDYMPLLDSYRVNITATQYDELTQFVTDQKAHPRLYSLLAHNCNDWAAEAATVIGLKVRCRSSGGVNASSQCGVLRKYSSDRSGTTSSMRSGMIAVPLCTARSTSRLICCDSLACAENTNTNTRDAWIAEMIDSPQSAPGAMSRGAIQQRIPLASSVAQTASPTGLSFDE
jgi:hypothetical protein